MKKRFKILLVDDHPMIVEAYKNILTSTDLSDTYRFTIHTAGTCDSAIKKINVAAEKVHYDILFFDVQLPPSAEGEIISGEGLAIFAKKLLPNAKIVILTMFNENFRIQNILNTVNPDGLLIKNDITSKEFVIAFNAIVNNPPYYSTTVAKYFRDQTVNHEEYLLDEINRKIIFYLSKGIKTKNLINHVNLSISAIEKRKTQIKTLFKLDRANDEALINEAKKRGFI
jgi:DNA-binding NarL/FixJ family response regulator